jgi:hypothetical protein
MTMNNAQLSDLVSKMSENSAELTNIVKRHRADSVDIARKLERLIGIVEKTVAGLDMVQQNLANHIAHPCHL